MLLLLLLLMNFLLEPCQMCVCVCARAEETKGLCLFFFGCRNDFVVAVVVAAAVAEVSFGAV